MLTYLIHKKFVEVASGLVGWEKQLVISTGGRVVFILPHFVAQPPCFEIGVNCFDIIVCQTTCNTVGNTTANPPQHHVREGKEGTVFHRWV